MGHVDCVVCECPIADSWSLAGESLCSHIVVTVSCSVECGVSDSDVLALCHVLDSAFIGVDVVLELITC